MQVLKGREAGMSGNQQSLHEGALGSFLQMRFSLSHSGRPLKTPIKDLVVSYRVWGGKWWIGRELETAIYVFTGKRWPGMMWGAMHGPRTGQISWVWEAGPFCSDLRKENSPLAEGLPAGVLPSAKSSTARGCQRRWRHPRLIFSPWNQL